MCRKTPPLAGFCFYVFFLYNLRMYIIYALLGAIMASLGTIFAKLGLKGVDANLLTAIRGIVMAIIVSIAALSFGKLSITALHSLSPKQWIFVILSGLGGALSWLFFYQALSVGPTVAVTVIDKLSVVFTAILAMIVLTEGLTLQAGIGLFLVFLGTLLVSVPWEKIQKLFF
jgi:bacterial/archaeal transporter family protein